MDQSPLEDSLWAAAQSPSNHCFACGPGNPHGLHLHFEREDGVARARFSPEEWHGGWTGVVHGGVLATLLDEAMAYAVFFTGQTCVTARLQVRYRSPVSRGNELLVEGRIVRDTRRLADVEGRITCNGDVVAEASGRFVKVGALQPDAILTPEEGAESAERVR